MKKYVHDEVVRAWLDGKDVQMKTEYGWERIKREEDDTVVPPFFSHRTYRVKPTTVKYRRALYKVGGEYWVVCIMNISTPQPSSFVRWIDTDWQEIEIDV